MHKRLDFQILRRFRPDLCDLLHGRFARQHHALGAELVKGVRRRVIGDTGLGGDMQFHLRRIALGEVDHP